MDKYRPKRYFLTSEIKDRKKFPLGLIVDLLGIFAGGACYKCGNPECERVFYLKRDKPIPKFCRKCGTEIDWAPLPPPMREAIVCPKCGEEYSQGDEYCEIDGEKLAKKEVPLT